ncbi:hypothetical protein ACO0LL_22165 [Undibacterium sp. TC4M20W]|uniref:hypothetical protein n=1 Tax=Undibacterium sp. TC4M20W TaxID=3413052 RepID=UPI003BF294A8
MSTSRRAGRNSFIQLLQCFNVAAICALAVWHAYAFYLHQAMSRVARPAVIEFLPLPEHQQTTPRIIT